MGEWRVPLTEISLDERAVGAVLETLRTNWLTMGPRTLDLEQAFAARVGSKHAIAVSSGGAALHLACIAAGAGPGDEVIVPALSFVGDANAVHHTGATPVLADSASLSDPLIDVADVERRLTDRTKAVIAVHMFGYPADLDLLGELCKRRGIALIEDCCEAAGGALRNGRQAGTAGLAGCFSFFSKTQLGAGEGGIVVTDDDDVEVKVRSLRSHAMTSVTWDRHRGHAETYDITDLGFNYRIDEPRATLAASRLESLDEALAALRGVVRGYRRRIGAMEGVEVPFDDEAAKLSGHFAFPVVVDRARRDAVRESMHSRGVQTTFYPALTTLAAYTQAGGEGGCPVAEEFARRHLALPLFPTLDDDRIDLVVSELSDALLQ